MFNRILTWMNHNSDSLNANSKVVYSNSYKKTCRKSRKDTHARKDDWANRSSLYHSLSDAQKAEMDRVRKILDKADWEN